jgi:hypothetical protein
MKRDVRYYYLNFIFHYKQKKNANHLTLSPFHSLFKKKLVFFFFFCLKLYW